METNKDVLSLNSENSPEYKLSHCQCLSKICGCEINSQLTKGFTDSILEYFGIADIVESISSGQRLNAIHLWGTEDKSTANIENWLSDYLPFKIEWINDFSCNLVFESITECFKVMENVTEEYEIDKEVDLDVNEAHNFLEGFVWRLVTNLPEGTDKMFMRFANKDDVKVKGAESRSRFYAAHGNPRYEKSQGLKSMSFRETVKRNNQSRSSFEESDPRLVAYDDLPDVGEKIICKRKSSPVSVDSASEDEKGGHDSSPPRKRKMIANMSLYSDRIDSSRSNMRVSHDRKKGSVHSRLG